MISIISKNMPDEKAISLNVKIIQFDNIKWLFYLLK